MAKTQFEELLFYKDHSLQGNNIEIFFHKDVTYLLNEGNPYPVTKFTLTNCRNPEDLKFENIDPHNDGIVIEIFQENELILFVVSTADEPKFEIFCDKAVKEDLEYRNSDLIDIIKSIKNERNEDFEYMNKLNKKIEGLTHILEHDLENLNRKIDEGGWLTAEKLKFLEGQKMIAQKTLQYLKNKDDNVTNR